MEPQKIIPIPRKLEYLAYKPKEIYALGNVSLISERCITIVGTRKISEYGERVVDLLINKALAKLGIVVISGLAFGIDAMVHIKALERGIGTIAVVAGGIDKGFPPRNGYIYEKIVNKGCVISEFPKGTPVKKGMFPMRNRILAALSDITIVVEAPIGSGALITAQHALELGKEVYVTPGSIFSENSKGVHKLIKEGAGIITSFEDLLDVLGVDGKLALVDLEKYDSDLLNVIRLFEMGESFTMNQLIKKLDVGKQGLNYVSILTKLEIAGILGRTVEGNYYKKLDI